MGLDANVLIAGIRWPRWPHEVLLAALRREYRLVLTELVLRQARSHLEHARDRRALDVVLQASNCEILANPTLADVRANTGLIRSERDVAIALSLMQGAVPILVTSDRDFTDPGAASSRLTDVVRIMLPGVFLRDVLGWTSESLEAIRRRTWDDVHVDD